MKNIIKQSIVAVFICCLLFSACSEDSIGQYPIDSTPPRPISNPKVTNFSGGATITYDLPDETDLLYVRAQFTLPNGKKQDIRVSSFSNVLTIKGFARSQEYKLSLVAVDRSQNESTPVEVVIQPNDAIIYDLIRSLEYETARGGFKVKWENAIQEEVTVTFLKKNQAGQFELLDVFYTAEQNAQRAIRGQDAVPTTFAVFVKDTYNNYTDTMEFSLEPLYEQMIDNKKFIAMPKLPSFTLHGWSNQNLNVIWDDVLVAGAVSGQVYYITASDINAYFTMDLGVKVKLSRFRMWGRSDYYFRLHNPYDFYLMGTNDLAVAQNSASTDEQWGGPLINCISHRPSGLGSDEPATGEDLSYAQAGEEFEFTGDEPAVRYIRFRVRRTWGGSNGLHVAELRFWGEPINE
ncbi:hypothetical protein AGMMS50239_28390 [Bacteroidia bacterium]|nr:hypothetical protein AGMMS50239_28390 [Bacteroidia bacterium]GHV30818.1 hypothetical protein FACS1894177_04080 [Bacteroidia bacterium]